MAKVIVRHRPTKLAYSKRLANFLYKEFKDKTGFKAVLSEPKLFLLKIWFCNVPVAMITEDDTNLIEVRNMSILPELIKVLKKFKSTEPVVIEIP